MRLIRHLSDALVFQQGCALTIGNFDGVHSGHTMLLDALVKHAKKLDLPTVVMCFEPQPIEYFRADAAPARISTARDKITQLKQTAIDYLYLDYSRYCVLSFVSFSSKTYYRSIISNRSSKPPSSPVSSLSSLPASSLPSPG